MILVAGATGLDGCAMDVSETVRDYAAAGRES
jgi:hypothetical protein